MLVSKVNATSLTYRAWSRQGQLGPWDHTKESSWIWSINILPFIQKYLVNARYNQKAIFTSVQATGVRFLASY